MRRKSERTATKKAKASPEKKLEKVKRTRTRRRKQSSSSDNESEESSPVREEQVVEKSDVIEPTPINENSPEEAQDQVWQVKTAQGLADVGEIQKLKICLTRPPSTPERVDRSPRSKRKHSRATSSSDTPSNEGSEEKKKSRKSKRSRESKDDSDKNHDSQGDEPETETDKSIEKSESEVSQSNTFTTQEVDTEDTPMSTTNEDQKLELTQDHQQTTDGSSSKPEAVNKPSDADTTVNSPEGDTNASEVIINTASSKESQPSDRRESVDKSEVLEIHAEDSKIESSEMDKTNKVESTNVEEDSPRDQDRPSKDVEVSTNNQDKREKKSKVILSVQEDTTKNNIKTDVVESSDLIDKERARKSSTDSEKGKDADDSVDRYKDREKRQSESNQSTKEETVQNGQAAPIIVTRKRKWGSRPKLSSQKSITISTDVLKDIIPDVKPIEFNEVIEEKKHKRIEVSEKIERPVLPKIIIDNTENVEQNRMDVEDKEKENVKKDSNLSSGRRISIVKENDNVFARPPSPPRHKQSNILYITNLVRPFTLPQLKNLLQRTGRIIENGFWIDRIKSKCFVKYENEDQAVETRHALHGVTWPVSNPKTLQVDFSTEEEYERVKLKEETDGPQTSTIPGTVEDWLREQDIKRERGEVEKPWDKRATMREWDVGKNEKDKDKLRREERPNDKRRHRSQERSPEPVKKFKLKEEAPAKLLDDLFRKTKATPCIYWLPHSAETIAIKEELRRQQLAEHERRMQELRARQHQHQHRRH